MNHPRRAAIAANVRAEMARRQMPVTGLVQHLQLGRTSVFRRLNGDLPWTVDELLSVADALAVPVERLMDDGQVAV